MTGEGEVTAGPGHLLAAVRGTSHGFRKAGPVPVRAEFRSRYRTRPHPVAPGRGAG